MALDRWWSGDSGERYWVEITNRSDIGANLNAPAKNEHGEAFWSYDLIHEVQPGDIVYHYDTNVQAITGYSFAVGSTWADKVLWVARGTSARKLGLTAHSRDGFYLGLEGFTALPAPLHKAAITERKHEMIEVRDAIAATRKATYFPFIPHPVDGLRAFQGYLTKFPRALLTVLPELVPSVGQPGPSAGSTLGQDYREPDEEQIVGERDPFEVDPALVERGLRGHASTQNALAAFVKELGSIPRSPAAQEPSFDLAWERDGNIHVAEVKSCTAANQERQLRMGLGQVLRYRDQLERCYGRKTIPYLVLENKPVDASWRELCSALGVRLWWTGDYSA